MDNTPWDYTEPPHIEPEDGVIRNVEALLGRIGGDIAQDCRRALLSHLLATEGLPGVEEIDAKYLLRKMEKVGMENVYLSQRNQELWAEVERLRQQVADAELAALGMSDDLSEMGEKAERYRSALEDIDNLSLERGLNHIHGFDELYYVYSDVSDAVDIVREALSDSDNDAKNSRQSRLHELLEAEARERVEIREDKYSNQWVSVDGTLYLVNYAYGRIFTTINADDIADPGPEDYERLSLAFAALSEKRRRESESNDG